MPLTRYPVVHVAGEVVSGKQRCRACHMVLLDMDAMASDWLDDVMEPFPAGRTVLETFSARTGEIALELAEEGEAAPRCQPVACTTTVEASLYV